MGRSFHRSLISGPCIYDLSVHPRANYLGLHISYSLKLSRFSLVTRPNYDEVSSSIVGLEDLSLNLL